jgi:hypothetical protein
MLILFPAYPNLLALYLIPDIAPIFAPVRPPAHTELIANNPKGKIVDHAAMILVANHLRRHVAGRAACVAVILRTPVARDSKICYPKVSIGVTDKVLWFDIPMNDS